ncbi:MAG TPA: CorA family divalent cation transporter [Gemmatimonadales bacterium]|nr:CorA family divalent cation transporter [Gemmatimonadales bacterium]
MQQTVCRTGDPGFTWRDVIEPTAEELQAIAREYGMPSSIVQDCLDPEHLPKHERFGETTFLILRVYDVAAHESAGTIQELTRKIAIFFRSDVALTIHRVDLPVLATLRERFGAPGAACGPLVLLASLGNGVLDTYERPLQQAEDALDHYEEGLFSPKLKGPSLHKIHLLKRRVSLIKRMLWQSHSVILRLTPTGERSQTVYQDLKENAESYHFWADQLHEEIQNLLSMHVALASHRTNEVMRVLTIYSAFFLPLTFIVGIYGMNFDFMPELHAWWAYPALLGLMALISGVIYFWFRRRGWLKRTAR